MKVTVAPVAESMANPTVFGDATDRHVAETKLHDVIQTERKTHSAVNSDSVPVLFAFFCCYYILLWSVVYLQPT